jgi:hypothetical protein
MRIVRRFFYIWVMCWVWVAFKIICWRMAEDRRLLHSEAKKIGENHFALCSGHHVLIAPLSHANLSRSEHENLDKKPAKSP